MPRRKKIKKEKLKGASSEKDVKKIKKVDLKVKIKKVRSKKKKVEREVKVEPIEEQLVIDEIIKAEEIERDKRLIMWTGVIFFMVLILTIWIINFKNVFQAKQSENTNSSAIQEWNKITDEFTETWEKVRQGMSELKQTTTTTTEENASSQVSQEQINELKVKLEELENKIKQNSKTTTGTATSTESIMSNF